MSVDGRGTPFCSSSRCLERVQPSTASSLSSSSFLLRRIPSLSTVSSVLLSWHNHFPRRLNSSRTSPTHRPIIVLAAPGRRHPGPCCHQVLSAPEKDSILQWRSYRAASLGYGRPSPDPAARLATPAYTAACYILPACYLPPISFLLFCLSLLAALQFSYDWPRPLPFRSGDSFLLAFSLRGCLVLCHRPFALWSWLLVTFSFFAVYSYPSILHPH